MTLVIVLNILILVWLFLMAVHFGKTRRAEQLFNEELLKRLENIEAEFKQLKNK